MKRLLLFILCAAMLAAAMTPFSDAGNPASCTEGFICGDANADGKVDAKDVSSLLRYIVGFADARETVIPEHMDADCDGKTVLRDCAYMLRYLSGWNGIYRLGHADVCEITKKPQTDEKGIETVRCTKCGDSFDVETDYATVTICGTDLADYEAYYDADFSYYLGVQIEDTLSDATAEVTGVSVMASGVSNMKKKNADHEILFGKNFVRSGIPKPDDGLAHYGVTEDGTVYFMTDYPDLYPYMWNDFLTECLGASIINGVTNKDGGEIGTMEKTLGKVSITGTEDDKKGWIYESASDGVMIREAEIDSGRGGDSVTVVQLSDLHFNLCDEVDKAENNPTVMSTYEYRKWLADGASVDNAERSLAYAEKAGADKIVITGDVLDYISHGNLSLLEEVVWKKYPGTVIAAGNHEWIQCNEGHVPETLTFDERRQIIENAWASHHGLYYHSEVIKDKVMIVQLENGTGAFWESQVEPLRADIEKARHDGLAVLIFAHIPLATNDPAGREVAPIRKNDTGVWNFCDGKDIVGSNATGATKAVYDLIVNNADTVKGVFCGHFHSDYYTEISARTSTGENAVIPQYIMTGTAYDTGHALKITVK